MEKISQVEKLERSLVDSLREWNTGNGLFPEDDLKSLFALFPNTGHREIEARKLFIQCIHFCKKVDLDRVQNAILAAIN